MGVRLYQRRRRGPVVAVVAVLAALSVLTWVVVLSNAAGESGVAACPPPVGLPAPGEVLGADALDDVAPAPPSAVRVLVRNGGGQRGQANLVAAQLGDLGFVEAAPPDNDPFYPEGDMECAGQLRFGEAGRAGAATLALVLPCTELVRDNRPDDTVEVAIGTGFGDVNPGRPARDLLDQLAAPGTGTDGSGNTAHADPNAPAGPQPSVDPEVLKAARDVDC
jgi:hypothetical protein